MKMSFLSSEYVVLALIQAKEQIFHEDFITMSEFIRFSYFLQQEFNNRKLEITVTSNSLSKEDFHIINSIIVKSDSCCYNLNILPIEMLDVLCDTDLIVNFFTQSENEKIKTLETVKEKNKKLLKKFYN